MTTSHAPETSRWLKKKSRKGRRRTYMVCTPPANENVNEKSQPGTGTAEACTRVSSRSRTRHGRFLPLLPPAGEDGGGGTGDAGLPARGLPGERPPRVAAAAGRPLTLPDRSRGESGGCAGALAPSAAA